MVIGRVISFKQVCLCRSQDDKYILSDYNDLSGVSKKIQDFFFTNKDEEFMG